MYAIDPSSHVVCLLGVIIIRNVLSSTPRSKNLTTHYTVTTEEFPGFILTYWETGRIKTLRYSGTFVAQVHQTTLRNVSEVS